MSEELWSTIICKFTPRIKKKQEWYQKARGKLIKVRDKYEEEMAKVEKVYDI